MSRLPRRLLPSLIPLIASALAAIVVAIVVLGAATWSVLLVATLLVVVQWLVAPWLIERLLKARRIAHDDVRYLTTPGTVEDRIGRIVARRCADCGLSLVGLGVLDDDTPNAYTFGRTTKSSQIILTTGLVDRLGEDELDAVICHELGHIKHRDAILMTALIVIPSVLSLLARALLDSSDGDDDDDGGAAFLALAVFLLYLVSELMILSLSRSREYAADRWSCECTGNGDALASALVSAGRGAEAVRARGLAGGQAGSDDRLSSLNALGLMRLRSSESVTEGLDVSREDEGQRLLKDMNNRRLRFAELFSTHPIIARRIVALEQSGLTGVPRRWSLSGREPGRKWSDRSATCTLSEMGD